MSEQVCTKCKKPVKTGTYKQEIAGGVIREVPTWECGFCEIKYFEGWVPDKNEGTA
jgi:hypothetical protein